MVGVCKYLRNGQIMKEGMNEDKIILTKEEYDDLCANYNKIYKQAKADILGNISDGDTSCHWCINSQRKIGAKEAADKIYQFLMEHSFKSDLKPYVWINRELKDFFDSLEV